MMENENTLRRLNRAQLLDLLYDAVKEKEDLERELEETRRQLSEKNIKIAESGSIAEAALKLNRVFEQAQAAADQYLYNIKQENRPEEVSEEKSSQAEDPAITGTDAGWKAVSLSGEPTSKSDRKKLVRKLMQGAKVTRSSENPDVFCTDRGDVVFLRTAGDKASLLYRIIPLDQVLDCYYKKILCPDYRV